MSPILMMTRHHLNLQLPISQANNHNPYNSSRYYLQMKRKRRTYWVTVQKNKRLKWSTKKEVTLINHEAQSPIVLTAVLAEVTRGMVVVNTTPSMIPWFSLTWPRLR